MADEAQREQIRSIGQDGGLDIAWMEEASRFSEADFNELLPRMRGKAAPWRQIILTTNPDGPRHWINLRLIMPAPEGTIEDDCPTDVRQGSLVGGGEGTIEDDCPTGAAPFVARVYYSRAADNPHNPASYAAALDALTGVQRLRLRDGQWAQAEGAVYTAWDPAVHVVGDDALRRWGLLDDENGETSPVGVARVIASVDWGYTNPGVLQVWAVDGDGRLALLREVYRARRLIDWWVDQARALQQRYPIELYACDPSEPAYIAQFRQAGLRAIPAENALGPGIQAVQARLALQADGRPRLYLRRGALAEADPALDAQGLPTCTEQELPDYRWAPGLDGKNAPEAPLKVNDHGCDALRYAAMAARDAGATVEYARWA